MARVLLANGSLGYGSVNWDVVAFTLHVLLFMQCSKICRFSVWIGNISTAPEDLSQLVFFAGLFAILFEIVVLFSDELKLSLALMDNSLCIFPAVTFVLFVQFNNVLLWRLMFPDDVFVQEVKLLAVLFCGRAMDFSEDVQLLPRQIFPVHRIQWGTTTEPSWHWRVTSSLTST